VFRQIIFQVADLDAVLHRPEMAYMPERGTSAWRAAQNPYVKHWPVEKIPSLRAQYAVLQKLVRGLHDAGVPLLAGTDPFVPCVLPGFAMKAELEQLVEAGLSPYEALQAATSNGARFLNASGEFGTVVPGLRADLVLVSANPLKDN
jgi:imidazolonepropionase-like amidohydrolase